MMRFIASLGPLFIALACVPGAGGAFVVYNDGATHTLSSPSTDYYGIMNQSTFNVVGGGSITPTASSTTGNIAIVSNSGIVNVSGGSVTGGTSTLPTGFAGGTGILAIGPTSSTTISGGSVTGGAGITGGAGVILNQAGPTTISGGTITGGHSTLLETQGGAGVVYEGGAQLLITGGTFSGGTTTGPVPFTGFSLVDDGGGNVEVSGGLFLSRISIQFTTEPSRLDFFGSGLSYNASTGILSGTLADGSVINQMIQIFTNNPADFAVYTSGFNTEVSFVFAPQAVPEPASVALVALGLGGAGLALRSRRG